MDIHTLIDMAKERLLEDGNHPPIIYAEDEKGGIALFYFADLPDTTKEKQFMIFGLGRKYGKEYPGSKVHHLYFTCEAWTSNTVMGKKRKYNRPSDDPNRKEVLTINHLDASGATLKSEMNHIEILRAGERVELAPISKESWGEIHDHLLPYFIAGTLSAGMSDAELARKLTGR